MRLAARVASLLACVVACSPPKQEEAPVSVYFATTEGGTDGSVAYAGLGSGQVDRDGRPLVSLLLVGDRLRDGYNAQPSFDGGLPPVLVSSLEARLEAMDALSVGDGGADPVDWPVPEGGTHPLLPLVIEDALLVDPALSCTGADGGFVSSYLDIEHEVLGGPPHTTCGGRTPNEDVVDSTLTWLVTGGRTPVGDGVTRATRPATTTFPYLAEPN